MSLLLDALQRASKEKEKLAEARAAGVLPDVSSGPALNTSPSFPDLSLEPLSVETTTAEPGSSMPALELEPVTHAAVQFPAPEVDSTPKPSREHEAEIQREPPMDLAMSSALSPSPPDSVESGIGSVNDVVQPALRGSTEPALAVRDGRALSESQVAQIEAKPQLGRDESIPAATSSAVAIPDAMDTGVRSTARATATEPSPRIAREILAARAKPGSKLSPRLIGLAIVVTVIAAINAAFFLGLFDRLLGTADTVVGPGVAMAPPPPAAPMPAPPPESENAAVAQTKLLDGTSKVPAAMVDAPQITAQIEGAEAESRTALQKMGDAKTNRTRVVENADAARAASRQARTDRPVVVARKVVAANPLDRAYAALTEGRFDEAGAAYRLALEKNAGERDAHLGLAYIAHRQGNLDEARNHYQQVLRLDPTQAEAMAGLLGIAADGDLAGAAGRARDMTERAPESATALSTLGGILAREGRIAEAQQAYFRALTLEPEAPLHAYNLAVALDRLHKYAQAQSYYQRALALAEKAGTAAGGGFPSQQTRQRLEQLRSLGGAATSADTTAKRQH